MPKKNVSCRGRVKKRFFFVCEACGRYALVKEYSVRFRRDDVGACRHCSGLLRDCSSRETREAKAIFAVTRKRKPKDWYQDVYLKGDRWRVIRLRVLSRDSGLCFGCGRAANLVHHRSYDADVMAGYRDDLLVSLCNDCHMRIEFDRGRKVCLREANEQLDRIAASRQ